MSNLGVGGAAMQGISQGIQNVGAIYGIMRRKEAAERERNLEPLRERALRATIETAETQGKESALKLKELQEGEREVNFADVAASFRGKDPIGIEYVQNIAQQNDWLKDGKILQRNLVKARELSRTPEATKERAVLNINAIDAQLRGANKATPAYTALLEQKTRLEKLHGLLVEKNYLELWDDAQQKTVFVDKNTGQPVPELEGVVSLAAQKMKEEKTIQERHYGVEETRAKSEATRVATEAARQTAEAAAQADTRVYQREDLRIKAESATAGAAAQADTRAYQKRALEIEGEAKKIAGEQLKLATGIKLNSEQLEWAAKAGTREETQPDGTKVKTFNLVEGIEIAKKLMPHLYKDLPTAAKDPVDWSVRWAKIEQNLQGAADKITPVQIAELVSQLKRDLPGISGELFQTPEFKKEFKDKPYLRKFLEKNFPAKPLVDTSSITSTETLGDKMRAKGLWFGKKPPAIVPTNRARRNFKAAYGVGDE